VEIFGEKMKIFSVDVESVSDANMIGKDFTEEGVKIIVDMLKRYKQQATFFWVGRTAEKYKKLVKWLYDQGYEIASHGYTHVRLDNFTVDELNKYLRKSSDSIKKIIGERPKGFRAPIFSVWRDYKKFLSIVGKYFEYDSSIVPVRTPFYGFRKIKDTPFNVGKLREFPIGTTKVMGIKIPTGGFFIRVAPYIKLKDYAVIYTHPWEYTDYKYKAKSKIEGLLNNMCKKNLKSKMESLLKVHRFSSFKLSKS